MFYLQPNQIVYIKPFLVKCFGVLYIVSLLELVVVFFLKSNIFLSLMFVPIWFVIFGIAVFLLIKCWNYNYQPSSIIPDTFWDYNPQPRVSIIVNVEHNFSTDSLRNTLIACKQQKYSNYDIIVCTSKPNFQVSSMVKILNISYFITKKIKTESQYQLVLQCGQIPDKNLLNQSLPHIINNPSWRSLSLAIMPANHACVSSFTKAFNSWILEQKSFWNLIGQYKNANSGYILNTNNPHGENRFLPLELIWTSSELSVETNNYFNWSFVDFGVYMVIILQFILDQSTLGTGFFFLIYFGVSFGWKRMFDQKALFDSILINFYIIYNSIASTLHKFIPNKRLILVCVVGFFNSIYSITIWNLIWSKKMFFSFSSVVPSLLLLFIYGINIWLISELWMLYRNPNHELELNNIKTKVANWQSRRQKS